MLDLQQKSSLKYLVLEKRLAGLKEELDVRDGQLRAVIDGAEGKSKG